MNSITMIILRVALVLALLVTTSAWRGEPDHLNGGGPVDEYARNLKKSFRGEKTILDRENSRILKKGKGTGKSSKTPAPTLPVTVAPSCPPTRFLSSPTKKSKKKSGKGGKKRVLKKKSSSKSGKGTSKSAKSCKTPNPTAAPTAFPTCVPTLSPTASPTVLSLKSKSKKSKKGKGSKKEKKEKSGKTKKKRVLKKKSKSKSSFSCKASRKSGKGGSKGSGARAYDVRAVAVTSPAVTNPSPNDSVPFESASDLRTFKFDDIPTFAPIDLPPPDPVPVESKLREFKFDMSSSFSDTTSEITCASGFTMENNICVDINECDDDPCGVNEVCTNEPGEFFCVCMDGYSFVRGLCTKDKEPQG